jgi:ionotropic glutamate receptor
VRIGAQFARNSTIGRVAAVAVLAAVNDINNDSNILPGTKLDLHMHDSSCNRFLGIVQALQFMEKDTVAIIGPLSSTTAHVLSHLANELHVPLMSFSATDPTLSSLEYPFFVRTTVSDQFQMTAVADLVEYYGWKQVTTIFVDNDYGRNAISSLGDELSKRRSKILYKAPFRPGASNNEIADVLIKVAMMESRVIILHANPDSGLVVFQQALKLGMVSNGYAWIATDWLTSYLDPSVHLDIGLLSTMQGVLTLRHHTENTRRKSMLSSKWSELLKEDSGHSRFLLSTYGLYAYDTVWMLAHALDAFFNSGGNISFSPDPKLNEISGRGLNLEALSVFDGGQLLLEKIHQVDFLGATGPVKFDSGGNLIQPAYDIVSIIGSGLRTVGYWSNYSGLSVISPETLYKKPANRTRETQKLHEVIWPGETINKPRGWVFPNNGNEIKIGVPDRVSYRQFVSVDSETGMVRGLCIDVFVAAINLLAYPVPYRFVPFGNNRENPSYSELINKIITDVSPNSETCIMLISL